MAKELLARDGAIYIQADYHKSLSQVLMDEVFEKNFQREIIWRIGWLSDINGRQELDT
ncbi:MAG: hypothetical protein ACLTXL_13005 [Clostridia bacterium]